MMCYMFGSVSGQRNFRAKVKTMTGDKIRGVVRHLTRDSLHLLSNEYKKIALGRSEIKLLRIKRKGDAGRGMIVGGTIGFFLGGMIGLAAHTETDCSYYCAIDSWGSALEGGRVGIAVGSMLGAAAGSSGKAIKLDHDKGILESAMIHIDSKKTRHKQ